MFLGRSCKARGRERQRERIRQYEERKKENQIYRKRIKVRETETEHERASGCLGNSKKEDYGEQKQQLDNRVNSLEMECVHTTHRPCCTDTYEPFLL